MGTSVRRGTMMIASVLAAAGAARAQEMQMPKQEQHHQMEMQPVKPEYPRMGRAQENAKGALVTLEQVEKIAGESNPTLRQAEAEIRAARAPFAFSCALPIRGYSGFTTVICIW